MFILKQLIKAGLFSIILSMSFFYCKNGEAYKAGEAIDSLATAINNGDIASVDVELSLQEYNYIDSRYLVDAISNLKSGINFDKRLKILKMLLNRSASINASVLQAIEKIQDDSIKLEARELIESNILKKNMLEIKDIISMAFQNDDDLIIKLLISLNKIKLEQIKELYFRAKNLNSKKIGQFLLSILRAIDTIGGVSKSGIATWNNDNRELPIEIIHHIARSID